MIAYVDEDFSYHGGVIAPGVGISLDALTQNGALLPSVDLRAPKNVICTNTVDCIRSAMTYGSACMIDGLIDKFAEEKNAECKIIATGGLAKSIICSCRHEITYDENIILEGLNRIYQRNNSKKRMQ